MELVIPLENRVILNEVEEQIFCGILLKMNVSAHWEEWKEMEKSMTRKDFEKRVHLLAALFGVVILSSCLFTFWVTSDWRAGMLCFVGCLLVCVLTFLLYRLQDYYITEIVADLSSLIDILTELEEREIFPDNEDTILSKLQSKVIKLVRILKNNNEAAKQEHENIKTLVSDVSHQLKTPLSNLKMYSEFLRDETLSEEKRKKYIEIICLSVERLHFLSENMIKISRLESGLIQLNMQRQSLNETVLKAVKDIYPKARQKNTEIVYQEETQIIIHHDRNWTAEAVCNLLDNAVKYSKEGSCIVLTVREFGMFAEVSVEDENGAIPETERSKIFTRFYRGKNSQGEEGIGVGLYLSREIAVKQGGYMNLKTTQKGNIFSIVLYREGMASK